MTINLSQRQRILVFFLNGVTFYLLYAWVNGTPRISSGGLAVWLVAALSWWLLDLISAPWFRPPRDALAGALTALTLLVTMELPASSPREIEALQGIAIAYVLVVLVLAVAAAGLADRRASSATAELAFRLSGHLSSGAVLFGAPALVSILGFYNGPDQVLLLVAWAVFAAVQPFALLVSTASRIGLRPARVVESGHVKRIDDPGIVRVELTAHANWRRDRVQVLAQLNGQQRYVLPMFVQTSGDALIGTGLICNIGPDAPIPSLQTGLVYEANDDASPTDLVTAASGSSAGAELVGVVVEGSEISAIRVELVADARVRQGSVLSCRIGDVPVLYQVFAGRTHEESFWQNPRGAHIVEAVQLGTVGERSSLVRYGWLPPMNCPVFLYESVPMPDPPAGVKLGTIESTGLEITADVDALVSHHAAILGITGTGKTELTFDVINAVLEEGVKVICVDLTGEYAGRIDWDMDTSIGLEPGEVRDLESKLLGVDTGDWGGRAEKAVLDTFLKDMKGEVAARVASFLESDSLQSALVELAEIANTRATLRATEMILSEVMLWCRKHPGEERVLVVLEEAHTVIPERQGAGFDFETQGVVGRIGQIALQGRKYGVGLLLVSQRTALVSKSILSQCNTVMAFSMVDQTSLSYLENVFGSDHVGAIPNLGFLEMIVGGKAVNSDRPALVRRSFVPDLGSNASHP